MSLTRAALFVQDRKNCERGCHQQERRRLRDNLCRPLARFVGTPVAISYRASGGLHGTELAVARGVGTSLIGCEVVPSAIHMTLVFPGVFAHKSI